MRAVSLNRGPLSAWLPRSEATHTSDQKPGSRTFQKALGRGQAERQWGGCRSHSERFCPWPHKVHAWLGEHGKMTLMALALLSNQSRAQLPAKGLGKHR